MAGRDNAALLRREDGGPREREMSSIRLVMTAAADHALSNSTLLARHTPGSPALRQRPRGQVWDRLPTSIGTATATAAMTTQLEHDT